MTRNKMFGVAACIFLGVLLLSLFISKPLTSYLSFTEARLVKTFSLNKERRSITREAGLKPGELGSKLNWVYSSLGGVEISELLPSINNEEDWILIFEYAQTLDESDRWEKEFKEELISLICDHFPLLN